MQRINIYIDEKDDATIDHLVSLIGSNRSSVIREAISEYATKHEKYLGDFSDGLSMPKEHNLDVWDKCKADPLLFIETFVKSRRDNKQIKLYEYQKLLVNKLDVYNKIIISGSRQSGTTLINASMCAHYAMSKPNKTVIIYSHKLAMAQTIGEMIKDIISNVSDTLGNIAPKITNNSKQAILLSNGSKILLNALTVNIFNWQIPDYIMIDNFAYCPDGNDIVTEVIHELMKLIDSPNNTLQKLIISSGVPRKANHFTKLWVDAVTNFNDLHPICVSHKSSGKELKRDDEWISNQIMRIGDQQFDSEFNCITDLNSECELIQDMR